MGRGMGFVAANGTCHHLSSGILASINPSDASDLASGVGSSPPGPE